MHLVSSQRGPCPTPFYSNGRLFARVNSLAYIFRKLRIHRNLSKEDLAAKCGVTPDYLSQVENGSRLSSLRFCLRCASEFGCNPNWVKVKWHNEAVEFISDRLKKQLGLYD